VPVGVLKYARAVGASVDRRVEWLAVVRGRGQALGSRFAAAAATPVSWDTIERCRQWESQGLTGGMLTRSL